MIAMILYNVILPIALALACILIYHFAFRHAKKVEKTDENKGVDDIIDSLPILYYLEEMVCDNNGTVVDLKVCKINKRCLDFIPGRVSPVGKYSSDFFQGGQSAFLGAANSAKQLGNLVNFQYFEKDTNIFYDCVAKIRPNTNLVEYFLIDCSNLHKTQDALQGLRRQMEQALEISHITPIKIYVDTRLITRLELDREGASDQALKYVTTDCDETFAKFSQESRDELRHLLDDLINGSIERVKYDMECSEDRGNGVQTEWYEVRVVPGERDANDRLKTLEGSIQLVTKRKHMEKVLTDAKKKAEELNSLKSAFLANMSHEIRTPLNAIVGFSELLCGADTKEEQEEYSRIIQSNSGQLLQLINDILDISKIEAGNMEFIDKDFDVNAMLKETEESLRLRLDPDKPVTLRCELGLPKCTLNLDRNRMVQVITNLVTNAIKYTDSGTITMGYRQKGNMLEFYVKDTGSGIDPNHLEDIFGRFVKLNAFMKGNGLGLSICKSIVTKFGGKIWAESELGKGSTFFFTIPYDSTAKEKEDSEPVVEEPKQPIQPMSHKVIAEDQKVRILVAEDNESNFKLVSAILSREYNLFHAWNGKEAVEAFDTFKPKLVIMDINLPVMDGYEASAIIKKKSPNTPILALTAYATSADEEKILASGMDAYMAKPVCMPQLRMRLKDLLKKSEGNN